MHGSEVRASLPCPAQTNPVRKGTNKKDTKLAETQMAKEHG